MDVDVVLHDAGAADYGSWRLPDPQLRTEAFVLVPCAAIAPQAIEPVSGLTLAALEQRLEPAQRAALRRTDQPL